MATALVDLYGGDDFERFDRIILSESYRPSEKDEFMCAMHRAYFLRKLKAWKEAIIEESRATMAQLQVDSLREPDVADRASTASAS
jgi:DnaK suppressor protein